MSEVWNSVRVYGPSSEIARFKRLCIEPSQASNTCDHDGWNGCDCIVTVPANDEGGDQCSAYVWNFHHKDVPGEIRYSFKFDTDTAFPVELFERLATAFPALAFDCGCIHGMGEFMGYGWFNTPAGGEDFSQHYDVPADHWTTGSGHKRDHSAQLKHDALVAELERAAREADSRS